MADLIKQSFKATEERYLEQHKDCEEKGVLYVPWNVFKTARLYLHNKGVDCKSAEFIAEDHYHIIVINGYMDNNYLGTMILLPDDTEGKAYGKADREIIAKIKK